MTTEKKNFLTTPSLRTVVVFAGSWLLCTTLLLLASTDFFQISFWRGDNLLIGILWLFATRATAQITSRHFHDKQKTA